MKIDFIPIDLAIGGDAMCNYADVAATSLQKKEELWKKRKEPFVPLRLMENGK